MMQNGTLYELAMLGSPISGKDYGFLPTITATEWKGAPRSRYLGSEAYRGARTSEALRIGLEDYPLLHPDFAEVFMGYPMGWTDLPLWATPSSPR
jgi:hypothetical protein